MITREHISMASHEELMKIQNHLVVEKMKLDKFFSIFLDSTELSEEDTSTPEWITYKEMLKDYGRVEYLINATKYRLG